MHIQIFTRCLHRLLSMRGTPCGDEEGNPLHTARPRPCGGTSVFGVDFQLDLPFRLL